jgi:hypothetical protein
MTLQEIKKAVDQGLTVHWESEQHKVEKVDGVYYIDTHREGVPVLKWDRYHKDYFYVAEEGQKFARICDGTGKPFNEGHIYRDGDKYFCNDKELVKYIRTLGDDAFNNCSDEFILNESYQLEESYYTEWEDEDDMLFIVKDGVLIAMEEE